MKVLELAVFAIIALTLCSCGTKKNPHRGPSEPFQVVDTYQKSGDMLDRSLFRYSGESVSIDGVIEIDRKTGQIRLRGEYRTVQELLPGAQLAIQSYALSGELLVRDLPRIDFRSGLDGENVATLSQVLTPTDLGLRFEEDSVLIQFNYIQEGEFWYDIKYPEIELPSIVIKDIALIERFESLLWPMPRIVPQGIETIIPALAVARKTHDEEFFYMRAIEAYSLPDLVQQEHPRRDIESAIGVGGDRVLMLNRMRFSDSGRYQARHGFVWDGVRWYGSLSPREFKTIWVVPGPVYLTGVALILAVLSFGWHRAAGIDEFGTRRIAKGFLVVVSLAIAGMAATNGYVVVFLFFGLGMIVSGTSWPREIRIYALAFTMFVLLEIYWSWMFTHTQVRVSGIILSIGLYAIGLMPLVLIKRAGISLGILAILTLCGVSNYLLMEIYADYFLDYPTLRVLGYTRQVSSLTDTIGGIVNSQHIVSLIIPVWFWGLFLRCRKEG